MSKKIKAEIDFEKVQRKSIDADFRVVSSFELTDAHKSFTELMFQPHTNMVFVDGPAGSAKTYCAAYVGLHLLNGRYVDEMVYIRSIIESASRSMGALPGEVDDKFHPWSIPLKEKLDELLPAGVSSHLFDQGIVKAIPVNYVRGLTFKDSVVIVDEAQNLTFSELTTIMTRFGVNSKMIVVGDTLQSDINGRSGFNDMYHLFDDQVAEDNGVFCFKFTDKDIMRSEMLKFIVKRLGEHQS
jgi:phosphate starvation-inducible PhoH-like protein